MNETCGYFEGEIRLQNLQMVVKGAKIDILGNHQQIYVLKNELIVYTLIERKSRMPQMQGGKGEVVVSCREPFPTKQMGYHRLSQRVNKIEKKRHHHIFIWSLLLDQTTCLN
jgi:hypothetical protein